MSVKPDTFSNDICFYATTSNEKPAIEISIDMATKWGVTVAYSVKAVRHKLQMYVRQSVFYYQTIYELHMH